MRELEKIFWSKLVQSFGGITLGAVGWWVRRGEIAENEMGSSDEETFAC